MLLISAAIRIRLGRPSLYRQDRPGKGGRPFTLVTIRTLSHARDSDGNLLQDAMRRTRLRDLLRSTRLDEMPELCNVLRDEMSLVGPRPLLRYLRRYSPTQARRHELLQGVTRWVQVSRRNTISWERRFELDAWYVDHASQLLDLEILARTVAKILTREGIHEPGCFSSKQFKGSKPERRQP